MRDAGIALDEMTPGPHVSEAQIERRIDAAPQRAQAIDKPETGGDSKNPFYDVFRSYSEPFGIKDEMIALAAQYRGLAKLVVIGQSGQGQDIVALKVTRNARNVRDGSRPAMLFSAVNHAREWIAAEVGRRMPRWWLEHADDPRIAELLGRAELWFLPTQNPDGYDYTFTCGTGFRSEANEQCGALLVTDPGVAAARHLRLQDGRRDRPRAEQRPAGPGAAQADEPPVAQDGARQRRRRDVRRQPGRSRPEPQLPDRLEPGRRGLQQPASRAAPIAARCRSRSPRTSPTTACCAGSSRKP